MGTFVCLFADVVRFVVDDIAAAAAVAEKEKKKKEKKKKVFPSDRGVTNFIDIKKQKSTSV